MTDAELTTVLPEGPNYEHARAIEPDELGRLPGNGGRPMDPRYIEIHLEARRLFVDAFEAGTLYQDPETFLRTLSEAQGTISRDYAATGGTGSKLNGQYGELDRRPARNASVRLPEAIGATKVTDAYGDPYGMHEDGSEGRFASGTPGTSDTYVLRLPGIPEEAGFPYDVVRYGEDGLVAPIIKQPPESRPDGGYHFFYPPPLSSEVYLERVREIGSEIEQRIKTWQGDPAQADEVLVLIAQQYQYASCARPYPQVNNSLFMNLANAQIKMLGLPGLTHLNMDIVAHRMQPENFVRYFIDRVRGSEEPVEIGPEDLPK